MKIDGMTASLFLCVAFAVGAVYDIRSSYNSIFTEWCSQYEMEYSYSLECCVNKDKNEIKKIEWRK
jgi:UDP-N-acetyl-D-mannosaminuronic acid transferase (WecB/TagA/CpsF family)